MTKSTKSIDEMIAEHERKLEQHRGTASQAEWNAFLNAVDYVGEKRALAMLAAGKFRK